MKKFFTLFVAAGFFSLVACGPAEEAPQAEEVSNEVIIDEIEAYEVEAPEEVAD
ncbi:MAG: hypothetical protein H0X62_12770, partial [Bacteroidetes bacterium]|nr:hypothetical protein [Bacteroidota bacterium]